MINSVSKAKKSNDIHLQFINHCALIIQTHWRGYIQRKRYRKFLPIYRRFREIVFASYEGWKIRKIMKLQHIKQQVQKVKQRAKQQQMNMCRIAKRQLTDQIDRLRRRGRWLDLYKKERVIKRSIKNVKSKENTSLYGNVKSKSIKNIFRETAPQKQMQEPSNVSVKVVSVSNSTKKEHIYQSTKKNKQKVVDFDEIELKKPKDFHQLLEQKLQQKISEPIQKKKDHSKMSVKKASSRLTSQQNNPKNSKTEPQPKQTKKIQPASLSQSQKSVIFEEKQQESRLKFVSGENSKVFRPQRLKITLSKRLIQHSSQKMASSAVSLQSTYSNSHNFDKSKQHSVFSEHLNENNPGILTELLKRYNTSYLQKKQALKTKIEQTYKNQSVLSQLQSFLNQK